MRAHGILAPLLFLSGSAAAQAPSPAYTLDVRLDPATGGITVVGRLEHACVGDSLRLYLNKDLRIEEVRDSVGSIATRVDTTSAPLPYAHVTRRVLMARSACTLTFRYRGSIGDTLMGINTIAPSLVELASYAGWYLESPDFDQITFDVTATLPAGWLVTGNGRVVSADTTSGRQTVRFVDASPGFDIVLVAGSGLRKTVRATTDGVVEMYSPPPDSAIDTRVLDDLLSALRDYSSWFGPAAMRGTLRVVYSPRGGSAYSRIPLIINSATYRRQQLAQPFGPMLVMQGAAHELAHFWWAVAETATGEDWINEGLAEYSALSAVAARFGEPARDSLLARYRRDAAESQTSFTIAATPTDSPDRYVNRYEKPALLFTELEEAYGPGSVRKALRAVYTRFRGTTGATTSAVLSIVRDVLGPEAGARLEACLVQVAWRDRCPG